MTVRAVDYFTNNFYDGFEEEIFQNPNIVWKHGLPALCDMIRTDSLTVEGLEAMVRNGGDLRCRDPFGADPLIYAVREGRDEMVGALLKLGANPNSKNDNGDTPLLIAIRNVDFYNAVRLIEAGADVGAYEKASGKSLLWSVYEAARLSGDKRDEERFLRLLLDNGANPDCYDKDGRRALTLLYAFDFRYDCLQVLLGNGADPDLRSTTDHSTPLDHAVYHDDITLAKMLLEKGARPDGTATYPRSLLVQAAANGDTDMIDLLLAYGADINKVQSRGFTPLTKALTMGVDADMIEYLLKKGADANAPCRSIISTCPLHVAAKKGLSKSVNALLSHGADPLAENQQGQTAYMLAKKSLGDDHAVTARLQLAENAARVRHAKKPRGPAP